MIHDSKRTFLLLVPLLAFVILKGIIPGFTVIQTDFPNYYTAGSIAREGEDTERLYDDIWFQEQIHKHGMSVPGKFSPFPPPTAILFIPFSYLAPLAAQQTLNILNVLLLACAVVIVSRLFDATLLEAVAFVLLSGWGVANNFRFGQLYIALSVTILLGYYLNVRKRDTLAGISYGLLLPVKYFSAVLLVHSLLQKNWKVIIAAAATTAAICAASILILGWQIHEEFLRSVLGEHLQSHLSQQNPFSSNFQSFDSLLRRLFLFDETLNPYPLYPSVAFFVIAKILCIGGSIAAASYSFYLLRRNHPNLQVAILCMLGLLIAPATATYHFTLLWLPVGILLQHFSRTANTNFFWFTLVLYAGIGFLPYSFFNRFDGGGIQALMMYPRLILLLILFLIAVIHPARFLKTSS